MAEYLTRSSSGKKDSTASMSVVLPAALALWMMMASGLSSLRDTPARYATSVLVSSPMMPAWWNACAQTANQIRLAQPVQRRVAFLRRQRDDVAGVLLRL